MFLSTIDSIRSAILTSDIDTIKITLDKSLNKYKETLPSEAQKHLENINTLIASWEAAKNAVPASTTSAETKKSETKVEQEKPAEPKKPKTT